MIVFIWSIFILSLFLMGYAVYRVLEDKEELQAESLVEPKAESQELHLEDEDSWMLAAIKMSVHELLTFLKERNDLRLQTQRGYYMVNCTKPKGPITDSFVLPVSIENQHGVIIPLEMLEETTRTLGIKPQEVLRYYIAKKQPSYLDR